MVLPNNQDSTLERLSQEWHGKQPPTTSLTVSDLKIVLQGLPELQKLIKDICNDTIDSQNIANQHQVNNTDVKDNRLEEITAKCKNLESELAKQQEIINEKELAINELELKNQQLDIKTAELKFLRSQPDLASEIGLKHIAEDDDKTALIRMVAVLSQRDNIKRLWEELKRNCEGEQRVASADEINLFKMAQTWYNYNWQQRPYKYLEPMVGSSYDYEKHMRSVHTPSGETVDSIVLPGWVDANDKVICKPVVTTK